MYFLFSFLNNLFILFVSLIFITNIPIIFRSFIYDNILTDYTINFYENFFNLIQEKIKSNNIYSDEKTKIRILDIGIGTGTALGKYLQKKKDDIEFKNLLNRIEYFGIDVDNKYLENCKNILGENSDLNFDLFNLNLMNEYNRQNNKIKSLYKNIEYENIGKYDFIFFSDSFSVIPTINNYSVYNLLKYIQNFLLNPNGSLCIGTTINYKYNKVRAFIKKNIVKIFGVNFGDYIIFNQFILNLIENNIIIKNNDFVKLDNTGKDITNCSKYFLEYDKVFTKDYINEKCKYIIDNYNGIDNLKNIFDRYLFLYGNTHSFFIELTSLN